MNPGILYEYYEMPNGERKDELRDQIIAYYLSDIRIAISAFLKNASFKYNEVNDYLDIYVRAVDKALSTYDRSKSSFYTFLKNIVMTELYKDVGADLKKNYFLVHV